MFEEWRREYVVVGECDINFIGSSLVMEFEGVVVIWNRLI